jgi:heme exporter protein D
MLGPYAAFVISSYAIAAVVVLALTVWVVADHRRQQASLADLEARGVTRRSQREASS